MHRPYIVYFVKKVVCLNQTERLQGGVVRRPQGGESARPWFKKVVPRAVRSTMQGRVSPGR